LIGQKRAAPWEHGSNSVGRWNQRYAIVAETDLRERGAKLPSSEGQAGSIPSPIVDPMKRPTLADYHSKLSPVAPAKPLLVGRQTEPGAAS
jgi:hypothetical protein